MGASPPHSSPVVALSPTRTAQGWNACTGEDVHNARRCTRRCRRQGESTIGPIRSNNARIKRGAAIALATVPLPWGSSAACRRRRRASTAGAPAEEELSPHPGRHRQRPQPGLSQRAATSMRFASWSIVALACGASCPDSGSTARTNRRQRGLRRRQRRHTSAPGWWGGQEGPAGPLQGARLGEGRRGRPLHRVGYAVAVPGPDALLQHGGVRLKPGRMYAMTYQNVSRQPCARLVLDELPDGQGLGGGSQRAQHARSAHAGRDRGPRPARGRRVVDERRAQMGMGAPGRAEGFMHGSYPGSRTDDGGVRLPWYGWQTEPAGRARSNQPYYAYRNSGSYTLTVANAPRAVRLTEAGGYAPVGRSRRHRHGAQPAYAGGGPHGVSGRGDRGGSGSARRCR